MILFTWAKNVCQIDEIKRSQRRVFGIILALGEFRYQVSQIPLHPVQGLGRILMKCGVSLVNASEGW